jgi:hypothetical protein
VNEPLPLQRTREWLERAVIGLNLCPFAKAPHAKGTIRWVLSDAADAEALLPDLLRELRHLAAVPEREVETTLLVHPGALTDFEAYNDFLDAADAAVAALGLEGVLQVASFHPDYRFADSEPDAIENFTNRSPHPLLHLLRESSIDRAVASGADAEAIVRRNGRVLRRLGHAGWQALFGPA